MYVTVLHFLCIAYFQIKQIHSYSFALCSKSTKHGILGPCFVQHVHRALLVSWRRQSSTCHILCGLCRLKDL